MKPVDKILPPVVADGEPQRVLSAEEWLGGIEKALQSGNVDSIGRAVRDAAQFHPDYESAMAIFRRFCHIDDTLFQVRAMMAIVHLIRRFGAIDIDTVTPILRKTLQSQDSVLRGNAQLAVDDIVNALPSIDRSRFMPPRR